MHPTRSECDANNPEQFAAWCWAAGVPDVGVRSGQMVPLIPPQLVAGVSQMLWDFGYRHHPELQTKWIKGGAGLGISGQIVDEDPGDWMEKAAEEFLAVNNPVMHDAIKNATPAERAELLKSLRKNFEEIEKALQEGG